MNNTEKQLMFVVFNEFSLVFFLRSNAYNSSWKKKQLSKQTAKNIIEYQLGINKINRGTP